MSRGLEVEGVTCLHTENRNMLTLVLLLLAFSVSAEMLGYSYELDSPDSGVKNRARTSWDFVLVPLQRLISNIQVSPFY